MSPYNFNASARLARAAPVILWRMEPGERDERRPWRRWRASAERGRVVVQGVSARHAEHRCRRLLLSYYLGEWP